MRDARVEVAVSLWRRRVGQSSVFDADDARQEAHIAIWRAGETGTSTLGYSRILDAIRKLTPGWRQRRALFIAQSEDDLENGKHEGVDPVTPERLLEAKQTLARLGRLPEITQTCARMSMLGCGLVEIGKEVGLSHGAVSAHLSKVRVALRA